MFHVLIKVVCTLIAEAIHHEQKISTVIYVLFDVRNFTGMVEMVSDENFSGCSNLEIFNDTTTAISNPIPTVSC